MTSKERTGCKILKLSSLRSTLVLDNSVERMNASFSLRASDSGSRLTLTTDPRDRYRLHKPRLVPIPLGHNHLKAILPPGLARAGPLTDPHTVADDYRRRDIHVQTIRRPPG